MARDRHSHLHFSRAPAPPTEVPAGEWQERHWELERSLTRSFARQGLDFSTYRDLSNRATQNVRVCATVGQVTGRVPGDLKKIQERIERHEAQGTLRRYVLRHPDEVVAVLCGNTKRSLSILISSLDGPRDAYLQALKNLLLADLKPSARGGPYLDLYNAINALIHASYNYLYACSPDSPSLPSMQSDLCRQLRVRAEEFYTVLCAILNEPDPQAESNGSPKAAITEATMQREHSTQPRIT